jgi:hypothetical protein
MAITIEVNGVDQTVDVDGDTPLLWLLRQLPGGTRQSWPRHDDDDCCGPVRQTARISSLTSKPSALSDRSGSERISNPCSERRGYD